MNLAETILGRAVRFNNRRILAAEEHLPNPRSLEGIAWAGDLASAWPAIRGEWEAFCSAGGRLPLIEEVIEEHQGNDGEWRAGLLFTRGKTVQPLAGHFPSTIEHLRSVSGLRYALWSRMEPGTELPEHVGPNAGVLRYHLGVDCGDGAALRVGDRTVPYVDGRAIMFDDTMPHAAWNRGATPRVTLFCEVERPLPTTARLRNRAVQWLISQDARYRSAPARAARMHERLNASE